jgi:hypothetical protein
MNPGLTSPVIDDVLRPADLSDASVRERLSPVALHAFFAIMQRWRVSEDDARELLGGVEKETYDELKSQSATRTLDADTLIRISYIVGIYKALNILLSQPIADEWVTLPNSDPLFGGKSPLCCMIESGAPMMQRTRQLLDAVQEGA